MSLRSLLALLFCAFLLLSCGKDTEEEVADAILTGNQLLSNGKCDEAIRVLEGVGRRTKNARYLVVLSSAYACKAGYSELTLFSDDLSKFGTPSELGGLTRFSTADDVTDIDEEAYTSLKTAIEVLLFSGGSDNGVNPSIAKRESSLGSVGAAEVHAMLLYEIMAQLGRFLELYGNPDAAGNKGAGTAPAANTCLIDYDNVALDNAGSDLDTYITDPGTGGACDSRNDGNPTLNGGGTYDVEKLCEGVVMMNNFLNLLPEVLDNYSGSELSELDAARAVIEGARGLVTAARSGMDDVLYVTSFQKCIDDVNDTDTKDIQVYYAIILEGLFR